jgi:hypothetical protein
MSAADQPALPPSRDPASHSLKQAVPEGAFEALWLDSARLADRHGGRMDAP